jgi:hypothetical protein
MVSNFYKRHSGSVLLAALVALPFLTIVGELVPSNNDIETWLPRHSQVRQDYDNFCRTFGADETILIAFEKPFPSPERIEAVSNRLAGLEGVGTCWSRQQVTQAMLANDVSAETAEARLINLLATPHGDLETMLVSLNQHGTAHRKQTLDDVKAQLAYCQMPNAILAGGSVVACQLDKLGSRERARVLFGLTLLICFGLLYINIGCWKTAGAGACRPRPRPRGRRRRRRTWPTAPAGTCRARPLHPSPRPPRCRPPALPPTTVGFADGPA